MRLIFHGLLRKLYGVSVTMRVDTVADAIEGFSRQQANWPKDVVLSVVGFDTEEKLHTPADEVHIMPALTGGGGKIGKIIIGSALIAAGILLAPYIGPLSAVLISMGAGMVLSGVMGFFMKSPKIQNSNDPAASKYLGINANTTASGTPITMAWGTIDLAGQWLSLQSDSINLSQGSFPANPT